MPSRGAKCVQVLYRGVVCPSGELGEGVAWDRSRGCVWGEVYLFGCTEPVPPCAQGLGCVLGVFGFGSNAREAQMEWTDCERTCLSDCWRVSMGVLRDAGAVEREVWMGCTSRLPPRLDRCTAPWLPLGSDDMYGIRSMDVRLAAMCLSSYSLPRGRTCTPYGRTKLDVVMRILGRFAANQRACC